MLDIVPPSPGSGPGAAVLIYGSAGLLLVMLLLGAWLLLGRGPRMRRGLKHVHRLRRLGDWQNALKLVHDLQDGIRPGSKWAGRLRTAEGECRRDAGVAAVQAGAYEDGMEHHLRAAELLGSNPAEVRNSVIEQMLAEVRRLFAATTGKNTDEIHKLIGRVLILQSPCPEASFWQGLCHVREGQLSLALQSLAQARGGEPGAGNSGSIDPPLYLGGLMLRLGQPRDAVRFLTEANRLDSNCPLVTLQLGRAVIESGGDPSIAVRAIQRALGERGLTMWLQQPERFWIEGFPETRSFVRRLASKYRYLCPLWGGDVQAILREGKTALGQGLYRIGNFQAAADVFRGVMQEAAPSLAVLRGLGLALTRAGRYDEAFKHLRTALELEDPKDRLTAGYLALCGARGKPAQPEDKVSNVSWAISVVRQHTALGDAEWAGLLSHVYAEAWVLSMALSAEDQLHLCDHLASVHATDPLAAEAYHHLAATHPEALRPQHAWLYCRAAQQHDLTGPHAVDLFARTFATQADARTYFAAQQWDFDELEYAFLARAAQLEPGAFPAVLGPEYPAQGEAFLLARSAHEEEAKHPDAALATAEVLFRLAPRSPRVLDRLAYLHHRRGEHERAWEFLQAWHELQPTIATPLVRLAVIQEQLGQVGPCLESIRRALPLVQGVARAEVAFLGARLTLAALNGKGTESKPDAQACAPALEMLGVCLKERPDHPQALSLLAAVRSVAGDRQGLASLVSAMNRPDVTDARFHYLAGVCRLAAGDYEGVLESCRRAAADPAFAVESAYLAGWANLYRQSPEGATEAFRQVAKAGDSPSAGHAQAILGAIRFHEGGYEEAVHWWKLLDAERRKAWGFDDPLHKTMFLAALTAYQAGRYEQAAEKLREAGRLGLRDRRLGSLLTLALVKAGQRLLYKV
jgi:tetratricopeptide (TPR) repeat protein